MRPALDKPSCVGFVRNGRMGFWRQGLGFRDSRYSHADNSQTSLFCWGCPCLEKPVTPAMVRDLIEELRQGRSGKRARR